MSQEKRRSVRIPVNLELNVSSVFKQDNVKISNVNSPIDVTDISKNGIGFISKSILPLDYYFNASLKLGSENDTLYCVVKIIRCQPISDNKYAYGCEYVGMAPVLNYIFDDFEAKHNIKQDN